MTASTTPRHDPRPGRFEAHVTVRAPSRAERARFFEACASLGVKPIDIVLADDDLASQPMTASLLRGPVDEALVAAQALADAITARGFEVARVKLEAIGRSAAVPESDDAAHAQGSYFEYHVKVLHAVHADLNPLRARCRAHGARLSRNARAHEADGVASRFVTLRVYGRGRLAAHARFDALTAALVTDGYALGRRQREYVVYDSDASLDEGWRAP